MKRIICFLLCFTIFVSSGISIYADEGQAYIYRNNTYDFKIMNDPMDISDESFFGVWNPLNSTWTVEGYFKYDKYPEMSKVEAAVKNGNYSEAKKELLEYYRAQKPDLYKLSTNFTGTTQVQDKADAQLQAELQARNVYATDVTGTPIGIVSGVNTGWQNFSCTDVLAHINSAVASGNDYVAIVIASVDKSNTAAEIKSAESATPATLNLYVNGVNRTIPVSEDTYISPTLNANKNYEGEEVLYAQEYGYKGHWTDVDAPWGSEAAATKRIYMKFDISSLKSADTISSASLNFTARVAPGGDLTEKELFVYGWGDSSWKGSTLTWNTFSDWLFFSCNDQDAWNFYTSALSSEKGKICYFHRGALPFSVAKMYGNTGEEKYAYTFLRQMMSCAYYVGANKLEENHNYVATDDKTDVDLNNPDPHRVISHLDIGGYVTQIANGFVMVWESDTLTENPYIFTAMLKNLVGVTDYMCEYIVEKDVVLGNIATSWNRSLYLMCNLFPEIKQSDYWYNLSIEKNDKLLGEVVLADGSSYTQAMQYISTEMSPFINQYDVYSSSKVHPYGKPFGEKGEQTIYKVIKNALYSTSPGWGGFNFGDSIDHGKSYVQTFKGWNVFLKNIGVDDPEVKYVASEGKEGHVPDFTSISFPDARRTYMRTGWTNDATALAFTAKGNASGHMHNDQMSVVLMAYGKSLLVDPSYASILTDDKYKVLKSAKSHNTITVNGKGIEASKGQDSVEKEMELNNLYNLATYTYAYVQDASDFQRSVLFPKNEEFFIVSDYIMSKDTSKENVFTQFWNMLPDANIYISDKGEFKSSFESGANVIVAPVDVDGMSDVRLEDSLYCPAMGSYQDNKKGVYERKSNTSVKYGTVLYPLKDGQERQIETRAIETPVKNNGANAFSIIITDSATGNADTYYYYHLNDASQKQEVVLGNYRTDASTVLIHEDSSGKLADFFVYEGSYIKKDGLKYEYLFKSAAGDMTFGADYSSENTIIISSDSISADDLKNISLYTGSTISSSIFNGETVPSMKKQGSYCYYGDMPVIKQTMSETKTDYIKTWLSYFDGSSPGSTSGNMAYNTDKSLVKKSIALSGNGEGTLVSEGNANDGYYIKNTHSYLISNYRTSLVAQMPAEKPVFSFKYDIKIPDDGNVNSERKFVPLFTATATGISTQTNPTSLAIKYSDRKFTVSNITGLTSDEDPKTVDYTPDTWVTVEYRAYRGTDGKLTCVVYIDGEQIYFGVGSVDYSSAFALNNFTFTQGKGVTTYMDEIIVSVCGENYIPTKETVLFIHDFDSLTTTSATNSLNVPYKSGSLLYNPKTWTNSSSTNRNTDYVGEERENNGMALVVTTSTTPIDSEKSSKKTIILNQPNRDFAEYVNEDGNDYIIGYSHDIYIPEASKQAEREYSYSFSGRGKGLTDFIVKSTIKDGKLDFGLDISSEYVKITELTERRKTADIPSDVWNTIKYVMKLKYDVNASAYDVNIYGIYDGKCWYECAFKAELTAAEGIYMLIQRLEITGLDDKPVVTKLDNAKVLSYSAMPEIAYAWTDSESYIYPLALYYADGSVTAKARAIGEYASICLVTAVYNENGKLMKLWTDTTLEDGYLSYTVTGSDYIKSGYKVKAFLVDSITTLVPYVENVGLVIE